MKKKLRDSRVCQIFLIFSLHQISIEGKMNKDQYADNEVQITVYGEYCYINVQTILLAYQQYFTFLMVIQLDLRENFYGEKHYPTAEAIVCFLLQRYSLVIIQWNLSKWVLFMKKAVPFIETALQRVFLMRNILLV